MLNLEIQKTTTNNYMVKEYDANGLSQCTWVVEKGANIESHIEKLRPYNTDNGARRFTYKDKQLIRVTDSIVNYQELSNRLISKKLHHCSWIKSIRSENNYNGTTTIKIIYDNNTTDKFVIKS